MNVLVTGAGGFVGRATVAALTARGHRVRGTRRRPHEVDGVAEWIDLDIGPTTDWSSALAGVDAVVHTAAVVHRPDAAIADHDAVTHLGSARLAEQAAGRVESLLLIGTVAVYGDRPPPRVDADTEPRPDTPYGAAKLAAERRAADLCAPTGTRLAVLRFPAVYGPGDPGNVGRLIRLVLRGVPLPLAGVNNERSFLALANAADAVATVVGSPVTGTYLVADEDTISTPDLIRLIARCGGIRPRLVRVPRALLHIAAAAGDRLGRRAPIDRAALHRLTGSLVVDGTEFRRGTGWRPVSTLESGIEAAVAAVQAKVS